MKGYCNTAITNIIKKYIFSILLVFINSNDLADKIIKHIFVLVII